MSLIGSAAKVGRREAQPSRVLLKGLVLLLLFIATVAKGAGPFDLAYSGRLVDGKGKPLAGPVNISISFFDDSAKRKGGTYTFPAVSLKNGIFDITVSLVGEDYSNIFGGGSTWIEVTDATHGKVYPKQKFFTVPFALRVPVDNESIQWNSGNLLVLKVKIGDENVPTVTPRNGQILQYAASAWTFVDDISGASGIANGTLTSAMFQANTIRDANIAVDGVGIAKIAGLGASLIQKEAVISSGNTAQYWRGDKSWQILDSAAVDEGIGLYFTPDRVHAALSSSAPLVYDNSAGILGIHPASHLADGYLLAGDWSFFNSKQAALGFNPVNKSGDTMSGDLSLTGGKELFLASSNTSNQVGFKAPSTLASSLSFTLPGTYGVNGQILATDGSGALSFITQPAIMVSSVAGSVGDVTLSTSDVAEGANPYYSDAHSRAALSSAGAPIAYSASTGAIGITQAGSGSSGYLSASDWLAFNGKGVYIGAGIASQYWRGDKSWQTLDTSVALEGSNLYFTLSRARAAFSAVQPVFYDNGTGIFSIDEASSLTDGYLASTDWAAFNGKQSTLAAATGTVAGYIAAADWIAFNGRGGVSSIATGTGLAGGVITANGTIALATSGVWAGSYTRANVTVDSYGRIIAAANGPAVNLASGEISGTLAIAGGGTGATTAADARTNLGLGNLATINAVTSSEIADGAIGNIDIASSAAIAEGKIANLPLDLTAKEPAIGLGTVLKYLRGDKAWQILGTSAVAEGSNLYFTSSRAKDAFSAAQPTVYDNSSGILSLGTASSLADGYLAQADWTTFNGKLTSFSVATSSSNGYVASSDWITFNGKSVGTVTGITAGSGLAGGTIIASGTLALATSGVTAGTYTRVNLTTDIYGRMVNGANSPAINLASTDVTGALLLAGGGGEGSTAAEFRTNLGLGALATMNAVGSSEIIDGAILDTNISSTAAISESKITNLAADLAAREPSFNMGNATQYLRGDKSWQVLNTSVVGEASSLYFTPARARGALAVVQPLAYNNSSGMLNIVRATGFADGYLASTDWIALNSRQSAMAAASNGISGYFASSDWINFNSKGNGNVVGIAAGIGLVGGPISANGTLALSTSGVTPNGYTRGNITVDGYGRVLAAANSQAVNLASADVTGTLGVAGGGTGATTVVQARTNLGLGNLATINAISSAEIANNTMVNVDIAANAAIAESKIANLTTDLAGKEPAISAGGVGQYWRGDKSWQMLNNSAVAEASNLYFTASRTRAAVSGVAPLAYNNSTGMFSMGKAGSLADGYLASSDWIAFNSKQAPFAAAAGGVDGYVSTGDWIRFNAQGSVTAISAGAGLQGGPITNGGTLGLAASGVTAGSYTRANVTVDSLGRILIAATSPAINLANMDVSGALGFAGGGTGATTDILARSGLGLGTLATISMISSAEIANNTIVNADISGSAAILESKIANLTTDLNGKEPAITVGATIQFRRGDKSWQTLDTSAAVEGSNLYFTSPRVQLALSANAPLGYNSSTGTVTVVQSGSLAGGYLSSGDWSNFAGKGGVAAVAAGTGLVGGTITTGGTLALSTSGVTAGTYTHAILTVDSYGRILAAIDDPAVNLASAQVSGVLPLANGGTNATTASAARANLGLGSLATLNMVSSAQIVDGSIADAKISPTAAVAESKIAGLVADLAAKEPTISVGTTAQYQRGDKSLQALDTSAVAEGSGLYFTSARARLALSATAPVTYSGGTGIVSIGQASALADGYLTAGDWTVFNGKQSVLAVATGSSNGYLASSDWMVLNNAANLWTTSGSSVNYLGGSVGIGVAAPQNSVAVAGVIKSKSGGISFPDGSIMTTAAATTPGLSSTKDINFSADVNASGAGSTNFTTQGIERMRVSNSGGIGIGTTNPNAGLKIEGGQIVSKQYTVASGATVDFNNGNVQVLQSVGGSAITLNHMINGGAYTLVVTDASSRTYTFTNCTNAKYFPVNGATTANSTSIYTLLKFGVSSATYCYISWMTGF